MSDTPSSCERCGVSDDDLKSARIEDEKYWLCDRCLGVVTRRRNTTTDGRYGRINNVYSGP